MITQKLETYPPSMKSILLLAQGLEPAALRKLKPEFPPRLGTPQYPTDFLPGYFGEVVETARTVRFLRQFHARNLIHDVMSNNETKKNSLGVTFLVVFGAATRGEDLNDNAVRESICGILHDEYLSETKRGFITEASMKYKELSEESKKTIREFVTAAIETYQELPAERKTEIKSLGSRMRLEASV